MTCRTSITTLVMAEYRGITVAQMTELRNQARSNGVTLSVLKNTLARRAVAGSSFESAAEQMTGPLIYGFSEDAVAAAKVVAEFAKTNDKLQPKVIAVGGQLYPASHVDVLASLPTREQALAMLARVLAEPASMFARAIKAVGDKLGGGDAAVEASAADAAAEAPAETSVEAAPETPADPA